MLGKRRTGAVLRAKIEFLKKYFVCREGRGILATKKNWALLRGSFGVFCVRGVFEKCSQKIARLRVFCTRAAGGHAANLTSGCRIWSVYIYIYINMPSDRSGAYILASFLVIFENVHRTELSRQPLSTFALLFSYKRERLDVPMFCFLILDFCKKSM